VQPLVAAVQADEPVDLIVVGLHVVVADRPIVAQTVAGFPAEVFRSKAQGDSPPMVGPSAEHAGSPPAELRAGGAGVGLAVDLPAAVAGVELAERPSMNRRAPMRRGIARREHL